MLTLGLSTHRHLQLLNLPPQGVQRAADIAQCRPCFQLVALGGQPDQRTGVVLKYGDGPSMMTCISENTSAVMSR